MTGRTLVGGTRAQRQAQQVEDTINTRPDKCDIINEGDFTRGVVSTGSTLLDCAISSNRVHGGGIPAGVILEIFGPSSSGKTALLAEIGASCKSKGGVVMYDDPEARLDTAYAKKCGLDLDPCEYNKPNTVEELDEAILGWDPKPPVKGAINVRCEDSLAAFSTVAELETGHKMAAAKRAASYHALFRKLGRKINTNGWIIACSNQEQVNFETGARTTPGGNAIKYWASIRMRVFPTYPNPEITRSWKISSHTVQKTVGLASTVKVVKNSCDDPFREVPIYIIFGHGIDDIRGNLMWHKKIMGLDYFDCVDTTYKQLLPAIRYIEENNMEAKLREKTIELWNHIEDHFRTPRKPKVRF